MFPIKQTVFSVIVVGAALTAPSSAVAADQEAISSKEQMHLDMIALAYQMKDLRPQMATSEAAAALYMQLQTAYQRMSDELGGDDPGRTVLLGVANIPTHRPSGPMVPPPLAQRDFGSGEGGIAGNPIVPPNCALEAGNFVGSTDFAINSNSTIASPIIVDGLEGRLWHVQAFISISHTFNADLDITLTSPDGTTVTISTDNGVNLANVFANTVFHDAADPDGAVPYTTNNGLVTDHAYINNVVATPLVPEEPFHAFAGEDPNGVWTLRITDDASGDIGLLHGWDISIVTTSDLTNRTTRTFTNNSSGGIPSPGVLERTVSVAGMGGSLCDVQVRLNVAHPFNEDIDISLTSPSGKVVTLTTDNGFGLDNVFAGTTFDDAVDPGAPGVHTVTDGLFFNLAPETVLTPEESFASLRGTPANGTWTLRIFDDVLADAGTFNSVSLILTTCSCGAACPGDLNGDGVTNVDDLLGVIGGWGACP